MLLIQPWPRRGNGNRVRRGAWSTPLILGVAVMLACAGCSSPAAHKTTTTVTHATAGCITAPTALVPCADALPGFTGRPVALQSALLIAPQQASGALRSASGQAMNFAWAAAEGQGDLLIAAWELDSSRTAQHALASWRAAVASRHPVSLKLGDGAFLLDADGAAPVAFAGLSRQSTRQRPRQRGR